MTTGCTSKAEMKAHFGELLRVRIDGCLNDSETDGLFPGAQREEGKRCSRSLFTSSLQCPQPGKCCDIIKPNC